MSVSLPRPAAIVLTTRVRVNTYIRILGNIKAFQGKRSVNCTRVRVIEDMNEINFHLVEVAYVTMFHQKGGLVSSVVTFLPPKQLADRCFASLLTVHHLGFNSTARSCTRRSRRHLGGALQRRRQQSLRCRSCSWRKRRCDV